MDRVSYETLSHTPNFDLPEYGPQYDEDLHGLLEEHYLGLTKLVISKKVRRGQYDLIGTIACQDPKRASKTTKPVAPTDEIAEYCMMMMQYDVNATDDPGQYRVTIIGPPGKGRWQLAKHVDLSEGDGMARGITPVSDGELNEQMSQYIGELHSQVIGMMELLQHSHKTLAAENKEMMKIVSDSLRKNGEIEMTRLKHELEMRMHDDDVKARDAEAETSMMKWRELLNVAKETGAPEAIVKAIMKKINNMGDKGDSAPPPPPPPPPAPPEESPWADDEQEADERPAGKKKKKKKKKATKKSKKFGDQDSTGAAAGNVPVALIEEHQRMAEEKPLVMAAEALKMSIDELKQWPMLRKILTKEQCKAFEDSFAARTDEKVRESLQALYELDGMKNLIALSNELEEEQQIFVDILFEAAMTD